MSGMFFILAAIMILSAVGVVAFLSPIRSALCLIVNLLAVAAIFGQLEAHFLAAVQIIVYAGAIVVLVLFVIMLLNLEDEERKHHEKWWAFFAALGGALFTVVMFAVIGTELLRFGPVYEGVVGDVRAIGALLYSNYVFPFEAASILIMAAIVGSVMLARQRTGRRS